MHNFYKFMENQEYLSEIREDLHDYAENLLSNLNRLSFNEIAITLPRLYKFYKYAHGKTVDEFMNNPQVRMHTITARWYIQKIHDAAQGDRRNYILNLNPKIEEGKEKFQKNFLNAIGSEYKNKKIIDKVRQNFAENFDIQDLLDYIDNSLPPELPDDEEEIKKLLLSATYKYLDDMVTAIFEGGYE